MIQISLTTALILYSGFLWRCVFCGYIYLDEAAEKLSQCPRCHSYSSEEDTHARYVKTRPSHFAVGPQEAAESLEPRRNPSHRKRPHQRRRGPRRH
jgi:predicted  nucleic acid-binding Zn-ribbon protein